MLKQMVVSNVSTKNTVSSKKQKQAYLFGLSVFILFILKILKFIGIDEIQFFDNDIVKIINKLADDGIRVIVAGLDMDFKAEPFHPMPEIMAISEMVTKLHAVCNKCGKEASRSQRLINGKPAKYDDPVVVIGASESYEARCRHCHEIER